ncbi:bifunctional DNA-formamidopyrimidine glycosylase/DNA-(apurinic or apyrimidinic site) lyase [Fontivita pretiosa]|uniref:bifunctional DNA-formamidopyrimidine glycosylase/DNA-(apurinic or apyrimidinic site) lyase n=1 Tax=Fontivita pretiosa TaxID=2989684 RepID=UPI003D17FC8F
MPELPEVQTVVNTLAGRILGRRIAAVQLLRHDIVNPPGFNLVQRLQNRIFRNVTRRGKRIVFSLDDGNRFYIHLGMSGRLTLEPADSPVLKHTHLILRLVTDATADRSHAGLHLRFRDPRRFGGVWWIGSETDGNGRDDKIGPEPLALRPAQLARRLARTRRAIKSALLDQTLIAGLGNIYADESLFAARLHPLTPANSLDAEQIARLNRAIKTTLRRAIRHRGSSLRDYVDADGLAGAFQNRHRVYDRAGQPCPACRTPIARIVLSGRSTCFCPKCQRITKPSRWKSP